jgi:serine/threonine protein phosphatase PrpC
MIYKTKIESHIGGREENQDYHLTQHTGFGELYLVCDGMGGHKGGAIASKLATNVIAGDMDSSKSNDPVNALYNAIYKANFEIFRRSIQNPELTGMGTTLSCLLVATDKAYTCHVGDSRIYQIRNNEIIFKTQDHSKVYELVKRGIINEEQARKHPESNIIERAMGIKPAVDVEMHELSYLRGDRFLLCTDGIHGLLSDEEILNVIKRNNVEDATKKLIDLANQKGIDLGGGHDNMTAAIVEMDEDSSNVVTNSNEQRNLKKNYLVPGIILILAIMLFATNECYRVKPLRTDNLSLQDSINNSQLFSIQIIDSQRDSIRNLEETIKMLLSKIDSTENLSQKLKEKTDKPEIHLNPYNESQMQENPANDSLLQDSPAIDSAKQPKSAASPNSSKSKNETHRKTEKR